VGPRVRRFQRASRASGWTSRTQARSRGSKSNRARVVSRNSPTSPLGGSASSVATTVSSRLIAAWSSSTRRAKAGRPPITWTSIRTSPRPSTGALVSCASNLLHAFERAEARARAFFVEGSGLLGSRQPSKTKGIDNRVWETASGTRLARKKLGVRSERPSGPPDAGWQCRLPSEQAGQQDLAAFDPSARTDGD
jgi:hypothetical protein